MQNVGGGGQSRLCLGGEGQGPGEPLPAAGPRTGITGSVCDADCEGNNNDNSPHSSPGLPAVGPPSPRSQNPSGSGAVGGDGEPHAALRRKGGLGPFARRQSSRHGFFSKTEPLVSWPLPPQPPANAAP